ncbi:phage tail protein [Salinicoccus sp. HZC-1]|uniref:phage tail protein n=1 Tax=Salinicoccus sp. HZC-1 TaxID=3385497 RepID=UPI00398B2ADA
MNFQGDWYHLYSPKEDKHGVKSFEAVLDFFHYFNGIWHVDEAENKSMMIEGSIAPLFINKDYILNIIDNFYANTMSYSKQQSSTERFLYFIGRHNAEFNIPIGTQTVQVRNRIGIKRDDIIIHEDDNLIDLSIDTDTGSFCTAIKGYYDFQETGGEDSTEKEPQKVYDYISPMASKYGVYYGEPIYDERYSDLEGIKEACKIKQESTFKMSFTLKASLFDIALNEGDEIRLVYPSKGINMYIRVVEISEDFDSDGDLIDAEYTFGNENISAQYRKMQYDAIMDINDILLGKKPIPYSVLPAAIKQATQVINDGDNTQFYYRANEIYGVNLDNPLGVTRYNANGLGFSQDGGETYSNAITYLGVVTEALTAGTIDANRITIYGSEGYNRIEINGSRIKVWDSREPDEYTLINNGRIEARGKHQRTWLGQTSTHDVSLRFEHGYIRARNNSLNRSLYFSDYGISTYADAEGNNDASGSLLFRDPEFSGAEGGGLTVHSTYGAVAMKSEYSKAVINSDDTVNLESRSYSVYVRPFMNTRNGLNEFQFYVKENESSSDTDGALLYGNINGGATHGSGIRFSKASSDSIVYATNINGDFGTGKFHASEFINASLEEYKENIQEWNGDALSSLVETQLYEYNLKDDANKKIKRGMVIGREYDTPIGLTSGGGISIYELTTWHTRSIQQLNERDNDFEARIKKLEAK